MKVNPNKKPSKEPRKILLRLSEDEYNRLHSSLEARKNGLLTKKNEKKFISKIQQRLKKQYQKYREDQQND